jgi:hypothetical protein
MAYLEITLQIDPKDRDAAAVYSKYKPQFLADVPRRLAGSKPDSAAAVAFRRNTVTSLRKPDACRTLAAAIRCCPVLMPEVTDPSSGGMLRRVTVRRDPRAPSWTRRPMRSGSVVARAHRPRR